MKHETWRSRLTLKIALVGLGSAVPLLASTIFYFVNYVNAETAFTGREWLGLHCLRSLQDLSRAGTPDRGAASAALEKNYAALVASLPEERRRAAHVFSESGTLESDSQKSARLLAREIGDLSNLILDPEPDSYHLATILVEALPRIDEVLAEAGSPVIANERARLAVLASQLREAALESVTTDAETSLAEDPNFHGASESLQHNLPPAVAGFVAAHSKLISLLESVVRGSDAPDPATYSTALENARDATRALATTTATELDVLLSRRFAAQNRNRALGLGFVVLALLSSAGLTIAIGRDLAKRMRAERESEARVRQLNAELEQRVVERTAQLNKFARAIEQSPAVVMITDPHGTIEFVNPRFTHITGFSREDAIGANPRILKSGEHDTEFYRDLWSTIQSGDVWHGDMCNRKKNGDLFWERIDIAPLRDTAGKVVHFVSVSEDITEQRKQEAALREAKLRAESANRAKSVFLANMSHEIRTPMNAILGFAQLMRRDSSLTSQQAEHLRVIDRNGEHLLALINDVLEMSKIEASRVVLAPKPFMLEALARDLESMFFERATGKGLEFAVENSSKIRHPVVADQGKLRQIFVNLLGNAVKFTRRGRVVLRLRTEPDAENSAWILHAEVEDSGPGISATELEKLFKHFEQTSVGRDAGGTGLGLAISREFARLMGGDISVESEPGRGSTFRVHVPLDVPATLVSPEAEPMLRVEHLTDDQPAPRVLVVDDNEDNRRLIRSLLLEAGFEICEATNGAEALAEFERSKPHCVLMDLRMPVMDGAEATRRIRARSDGAQVKIIALSASVFSDDRDATLAVGADDFLAKPFREAELFARLARLLCVRYRSGAAVAAAQSAVVTRKPRSLRVPLEVVSQLRATIEQADLDGILEHIERFRAEDPELARELRTLAESFQYHRMLAILDAAETAA